MTTLNPLIPDEAEVRSTESVDFLTIKSVVDSGRIPLLDGFRAVAVLLVVLAHGCQMSDFPYRLQLQSVLFEGQIGVDIFFALSGFLITSLLTREDRRTGSIAVGQFFLRRSIRILPAYVAFLVVVLLLERLGTPTLDVADWLGALTYTTNFLWDPAWRLGHLWSLSIEEHFYLVWPIAFVLLPQRNRWMAPVASILISLAVRTVLYLDFSDVAWMANRWTFTRCDAICIGCLLSLAASSGLEKQWARKFIGVMHPVTFVAALVISIVLSRVSFGYATILAPVVNGICIAGVIWSCLVRCNSRSVRWLDHRVLQAVGVRSYSIYLWQQLILVPEASSIGGNWLIDMAVVLIIAEASWRLVECPALALKGWACKKISFSNATATRKPAITHARAGVGQAQLVSPNRTTFQTNSDVAIGCREAFSRPWAGLSYDQFKQMEKMTNAQ